MKLPHKLLLNICKVTMVAVLLKRPLKEKGVLRVTRTSIPKVQKYINKVYDDATFKTHYRLNKTSFYKLVQLLKPVASTNSSIKEIGVII